LDTVWLNIRKCYKSQSQNLWLSSSLAAI